MKNTTPLLSPSDPEEGKKTFLFDPEAIVARGKRNAAMQEAAKEQKEAEERQKVKDSIRAALANPRVTFPILVDGLRCCDPVETANEILDELVRKPHSFECDRYSNGRYRIVQVNKEFRSYEAKRGNREVCLYVILAALITLVSSFLCTMGQEPIPIVVVFWGIALIVTAIIIPSIHYIFIQLFPSSFVDKFDQMFCIKG